MRESLQEVEMKRIGEHQRRGQSTLEYILVLAAIIVAVIIGANTIIKPAVTTTMTDSKAVIEAASKKVQAGLGLTGAGGGGTGGGGTGG